MIASHEPCAARWQRLEEDVFELKSTVPAQFKALGAGIGIVHESTLRLERQVVEARSDIAGLKEDVGGLRRDVTGLSADVTGLSADVTGLRADMVEVKTAVAEIPAMNDNIAEILRRLDPPRT